MVIRTVTASHWAFQNCLKGKTAFQWDVSEWLRWQFPRETSRCHCYCFRLKAVPEDAEGRKWTTMRSVWPCGAPEPVVIWLSAEAHKHTAGSRRETSVSIQRKGPCDVETFVEKFEYNQAKNIAFNFLKSRINLNSWKELWSHFSKKCMCVCTFIPLSISPSLSQYILYNLKELMAPVI